MKKEELAVLRSWVSLAYAIIGLAERDARKKSGVSQRDLKLARDFPKTKLYDICETLLQEYARV